MSEHAAHCALVLYAGMRTLRPVECDCDLDDDQVQSSAERPEPVTSSFRDALELNDVQVSALVSFQNAVRGLRRAEIAKTAALARLTEELAK